MPLRITDGQVTALGAAGRGIQELLESLAIELYDEDGEAVANEPFEAHLPDGRTVCGTTSHAGEVHFEAVARGTCVVTLPRAGQTHACETGTTHRLVKRGEARFVMLKLVDREGAPRAGIPFELTFAGVVRRGTTDAEGCLREKVPPGAPAAATLTVSDGEGVDAIELVVRDPPSGLGPLSSSERDPGGARGDVVLPRREVITQTGDARTHAAITPAWETRRVRVARGAGIAPGEIAEALRSRRLSALRVGAAGDIAFESRAQQVCYEVTFGEDADDFRRMLGTPELLAVYAGHPGYGTGPRFGGGSEFRMAKRYVLVPAEDERWGRGPARRLVPFGSGSPLGRQDCDVDVLAHYTKLRAFSLADLGLDRALYGTAAAGDGRYWGALVPRDGVPRPHAVIEGGWQGTPAAPLELGATEIRCRALVLLACGGLGHWRAVLRGRWPRGDLGGDAYVLDRTGRLAIASIWLHRLFTYPVRNAFLPWRGALEHAKRMSNRDLARLGQHYRMVTI
jgi:hypothetical protein